MGHTVRKVTPRGRRSSTQQDGQALVAFSSHRHPFSAMSDQAGLIASVARFSDNARKSAAAPAPQRYCLRRAARIPASALESRDALPARCGFYHRPLPKTASAGKGPIRFCHPLLGEFGWPEMGYISRAATAPIRSRAVALATQLLHRTKPLADCRQPSLTKRRQSRDQAANRIIDRPGSELQAESCRNCLESGRAFIQDLRNATTPKVSQQTGPARKSSSTAATIKRIKRRQAQ